MFNEIRWTLAWLIVGAMAFGALPALTYTNTAAPIIAAPVAPMPAPVAPLALVPGLF